MTTDDMLQALAQYGNNGCRKIATDIIEGHDSIVRQKTICGKFFQNVFDGKYEDAFRIADNKNKHAFLRFLFEKGDDEKADYLIRRNYFNYRDKES